LYFKVGEEWQTAEKFFEDFKGKNEEVFNIILNQGHFLAGKPKEGEEQGYNRCGNYGELIAPTELNLYRHMADYEGFENDFEGVYCNMHLADAKDYKPPEDAEALKKHFQHYYYNEGGPPSAKKGSDIEKITDVKDPPKVKNVFFYQEIENTDGEDIPYFYKMTIKKSFEIEFDDGSPSRMGYTTHKPIKRRAAANAGTMLARCFKLEIDNDPDEKEVTASRGVAEKILTGVQSHWTHGDHGDDYFVVVGRHGDKGDYQKMLVYKTASKDPLNFEVKEFEVDYMANTYFATYGTADKDQVRAKVGANLVAKAEDNNSLIDISNIKIVNEEVSKGIAASDLFKMIEEAMDKTKAKTLESDYDEDMFDDLFEEFERSLLQSSSSLLAEKASLDVGEGKESITIQLPKFTVTEAWGDPTSDAFNQIKPFVLRAAGKGKTYEEKFSHLQRMFEGKKTKITSPGRILATLILLESWVAIIRDFSPSAAGFLFEAFLAAMTFGEQVAEPEGGSLPIEDIIAFGTGPDGQPASLKLLKKSTSIKGSYKNLIEYFTNNNAIDYIVAYKLGTDGDINKGNLKLRIMKYEVNRDNFINFLLSGSANNKKLLGPGMEEGDLNNTIDRISQMGWEDLEAHLINTTTARGVTDKTQWQISRPQFDSLDGVQELANVDLTTETMSKLNTYWADQLGEQVRDLFGSVAALSENINKFFLDSNREGAKNGARMAIKDTESIKNNITGTVKEEEIEQEG
jgi:hypothetical protein